MKQFAKGNWGKPKGLQRIVKLRHLDIEPRQKPVKKKKRKKAKIKYIYKRYCCPFCHEELPLDEKRIAKETAEGRPHWMIGRMHRVTTCLNVRLMRFRNVLPAKETHGIEQDGTSIKLLVVDSTVRN